MDTFIEEEIYDCRIIICLKNWIMSFIFGA
jgi:hypothetical protein